jgi:hypothetical protein
MGGFSKLFVVGEPGGFQGADGVNPIHFIILIGNSDRQWLEVKYFDPMTVPSGNIRTIIPERPNDPAKPSLCSAGEGGRVMAYGGRPVFLQVLQPQQGRRLSRID